MTLSVYSGHNSLEWKCRNFPENVYPLRENDHLTKLLTTMLGDAGVSQLAKLQTAARLGEVLGGTQYSDLDYFFGVFLRFSRLAEEQYVYEPFTDMLNADQWDEVNARDASYRERIRLFLTALTRGGTYEGLTMAAEAACGYPCQLFEVWRYMDNLGLPTNPGRLVSPSRQEVVIVPQVATLSLSRERAIYTTLRRLAPPHVFITVDGNGLAFHDQVTIFHAASPSEYYEVRKRVTGVNLPPPPAGARYFYIANGVATEMKNFAMMSTQETRWSLNESVTSVKSFTQDLLNNRAVLPSNIENSPDVWGPWREFERADSSDNYPSGKYPGDPSRYDSSGNYRFAWTSQVVYQQDLIPRLEALGAEVVADRYRLPITVDQKTVTTTSPLDALAPPEIRITTPWFSY